MRQAGAGFKVTKNRLARLALERHGLRRARSRCSPARRRIGLFGRIPSPRRRSAVAYAKANEASSPSSAGRPWPARSSTMRASRACCTLPSLGSSCRPGSSASSSRRRRVSPPSCRRRLAQLARVLERLRVEGQKPPEPMPTTDVQALRRTEKWLICRHLVEELSKLDRPRGAPS
mgnify:CR=1 FL=1